MLKNLQKLHLYKRILIFIAALVIWFIILSLLANDTDSKAHWESLNSKWLLSAAYITAVCILLFPKKKSN